MYICTYRVRSTNVGMGNHLLINYSVPKSESTWNQVIVSSQRIVSIFIYNHGFPIDNTIYVYKVTFPRHPHGGLVGLAWTVQVFLQYRRRYRLALPPLQRWNRVTFPYSIIRFYLFVFLMFFFIFLFFIFLFVYFHLVLSFLFSAKKIKKKRDLTSRHFLICTSKYSAQSEDLELARIGQILTKTRMLINLGTLEDSVHNIQEGGCS